MTECFVRLQLYVMHVERETMEIFLTSIQSIVPIIVIIILGYFLQVRGWFQESFGNDLSNVKYLRTEVKIATGMASYKSVVGFKRVLEMIYLNSL